MSAPITFTEEFSNPVPAPRLFKAMIVDGDTLMPKLMPQAIKSMELIHGDGGPGSIKQMNFGELANKVESISYELKMEASPDGGCKGTNVSKYLPKPGVVINEEEIKAANEKVTVVFKAVEAYLLANPEAYA
ncbi:hypothetical protein EUGRSUZ_H03978 [Eucalyptus grandis]|uniref:Bet v I/Major latex protein domain-containing protein n=2 Tax=Eucalyptus grandis TaxID=71139 RepID=A0A059B5L8_EUCGR|nr:hypothetical protein EUGRSUZ_H03978 [Eucalyptus grandis]